MDARDSSLSVDHIQAAAIVTCDFLLGYYTQTFNVDNYTALLSTIPKFAACPVSVTKKNVQLIAGENMVLVSLLLISNVMLLSAKRQ